MLQFFRKKENLKRIMWVLAILIVPAFVLWGAGSSVRSRGLPKYAGKIFGKKVSFREYEQAYLACRNLAILRYGESFRQIADSLNLEQAAWERLIALHQAKRYKIKVSDQELISVLRNIPLFQRDGQYDPGRYNVFISYTLRISPREFEEQIRDTLKIEKMRLGLINQVKLDDGEVEEAYRREKEKAKALYVFIDPGQFASEIHPAYEQMQDYYQNHKDEFRKPDQVNVQYIGFYFNDVTEKIEITQEQIKDYYEEFTEQYTTEDEKGKQSTKPLEEVKEQIKAELTQDKIKAIAEEKIWQVSDDIGEAPQGLSFEEAVEKYQLLIKETGFFGPDETIPDIGLSYEFLNTAFSLEAEQASDVLQTPKGYFLIKVKEKKASYIPGLEEIKEKVEQALIAQEANQAAKAKGQTLLAEIKILVQEESLSFAKAAEKLSLVAKETEVFTRSSYISGIGQSPAFTQAAFALEPGEISGLIPAPNGYCILSLKEIIPIDEEEFTQEKEEFMQRYLEEKKEIFYNMWLANLIKQANLESNL